MAVDYFVKKCNEYYPDEKIKNYLVFTENERPSFWHHVLNILISTYKRMFVLYRTVDGTFIIARIGGMGGFTDFERLETIAFEGTKKKNQVKFIKADQYDNRYKLIRAYNTAPSDIEELVLMLTRGDYNY